MKKGRSIGLLTNKSVKDINETEDVPLLQRVTSPFTSFFDWLNYSEKQQQKKGSWTRHLWFKYI